MGLFYAEVTDAMKVEGAGGGNRNEGENIQVAEMSVEEASAFLYTGDILLKTTSPTLYGVLWFLRNKAPEPALIKEVSKAPANSGLIFAAGAVCGGLAFYGILKLLKDRF